MIGAGVHTLVNGRSRWLWLSLVYAGLGLGAAGSILPVLPTTPFLLVALWAGTRASPRLRYRLYRHPRYGAALRAWHRHGVVPVTAKWLACLLMVGSAATLWLSGAPIPLLAALGVLFSGAAAFILTRPSRP
jgi:uncharacterized membrane protein YbaN (DUF454 family)